jgi:hypothetical protein
MSFRVRQTTAYLEDAGEATFNEAAAALDACPRSISAVLSRMNRLVPKRVYIKRYVFEDDTTSYRYPRAVYTLGDKPDAVKPVRDVRATAKRSRERVRLRHTHNCVFNMGLTQIQSGVRK